MENYDCGPPPFKERVLQRLVAEEQDHDLKKCLNLADLIFQGLSHIVGAGVYVITPGIIAMVAGPSTILSYVLTSVVLLPTVFCYMDLGSRFQGVCNAYVYVYISLGEYLASLIWVILVCELTLVVSLVSLGLGRNIDKFLLNNTAHNLETTMLEPYLPDFLAHNLNSMAILFILVICAINCSGIKQVAWLNTIITVFLLATISMFFIIAMIYGSPENLTAVDPNSGKGGFFAFGAKGFLTASAILVVSYSGFESIVSLAAEAKNPRRDVPIATIVSYVIATVAMTTLGFSLVYICPWYEVTRETGLADAIGRYHLTIPVYIVTAAIIAASFSSGLASLTTLIRFLYGVSNDGLFFEMFSVVAECSKVPIPAAIAASTACIVITLVLNYRQLIHVVSGGIILTFLVINYTTVIISYRKPPGVPPDERSNLVDNEVTGKSEPDDKDDVIKITDQDFIVSVIFGIFAKLCLLGCILFYFPKSWNFWSVRIPLICLIAIVCIALLVVIRLKFTLYKVENQTFQCPLIPFIPGLGIAAMMFSFSNLEPIAHVLSVIYAIVGTIIYFTYGYFNSVITVNKRKNLIARSNSIGEEQVADDHDTTS